MGRAETAEQLTQAYGRAYSTLTHLSGKIMLNIIDNPVILADLFNKIGLISVKYDYKLEFCHFWGDFLFPTHRIKLLEVQDFLGFPEMHHSHFFVSSIETDCPQTYFYHWKCHNTALSPSFKTF